MRCVPQLASPAGLRAVCVALFAEDTALHGLRAGPAA